ncbi:MAG: hypothetical protein F9K23_09905 [Bacteroidetes bacterium]|nr:MAG: hypothetical protein F9K23_09905 [Bacteroidota bacterium]
MLAKVLIPLPFNLQVLSGRDYETPVFEIAGYEVTIHPPVRISEQDISPDRIYVNDELTQNTNILLITFKKDEFLRSEGIDFDPPINLIADICNEFLINVRYVTNAAHIKPLEFSKTSVNINYFNDDGSDLEIIKGKLRGKGKAAYTIPYAVLTPDTWKDVFSVFGKNNLPVWKLLLLDAEELITEKGASIVLMLTAIEVFISQTLDLMADKNQFHPELWKWINIRDNNYLKTPSIAERLDLLSKIILGNSLKERNELWNIFKKLQTARNGFAHNGILKIDNEDATVAKVRELLEGVKRIIAYLSENVPPEIQPPSFNRAYTVKIDIPLNKELGKFFTAHEKTPPA